MELQRAHVENASLDARVLLEHVLGISREQLLMGMSNMLTEQQEADYRQLVTRRAERRPIAQVLGYREFWGMEFAVTESTLTPRPDSETIIETILERTADHSAPLRIADLGTGTGCLLLSLLRELPSATGVGVDMCPRALAVAQENASNLLLAGRAQFVHSNWFAEVDGKFDIIVSNPPYIPSDSIDSLAPEVAQFEPRLALDGGADGLECYRSLLKIVPQKLNANGFLALEIGAGQHKAIEQIAKDSGLRLLATKKDLGGIVRALIISF
jgi:release factor glutamine methyltransferase